MYTPEALRDVTELTHRGTLSLLEHCRQFSAEEMHREIDGFGYPTLQRQLHHIYEGEQYWIDVLADRVKDYDTTITEDIAWQDYPTVEDIIEYGRQVHEATSDYLGSVTRETLDTSAEHLTWRGVKPVIPGRVVMRITHHAFHHRGQVAVICRILGKPAPPLDFPPD